MIRASFKKQSINGTAVPLPSPAFARFEVDACALVICALYQFVWTLLSGSPVVGAFDSHLEKGGNNIKFAPATVLRSVPRITAIIGAVESAENRSITPHGVVNRVIGQRRCGGRASLIQYRRRIRIVLGPRSGHVGEINL